MATNKLWGFHTPFQRCILMYRRTIIWVHSFNQNASWSSSWLPENGWVLVALLLGPSVQIPCGCVRKDSVIHPICAILQGEHDDTHDNKHDYTGEPLLILGYHFCRSHGTWLRMPMCPTSIIRGAQTVLGCGRKVLGRPKYPAWLCQNS